MFAVSKGGRVHESFPYVTLRKSGRRSNECFMKARQFLAPMTMAGRLLGLNFIPTIH